MAFTFKAKIGKEKELEALLNNPESGRRVAKGLGAIRNTLFLGNGHMIRVLEFAEDAKPMTMADLARKDPVVKEFLRSLSAIVEDSFDVDDLATLDDFGRRTSLKLAYEVRISPEDSSSINM